jgi:hypothetical protein
MPRMKGSATSYSGVRISDHLFHSEATSPSRVSAFGKRRSRPVGLKAPWKSTKSRRLAASSATRR